MKKIIVFTLIFLALVGLVAYVTTADISFGDFGTLSISGISEKKLSLDTEEQKYKNNKVTYKAKETTLNNETNSYNEEKDKYEKITDTTMNIVKNAIKEVDYSVEYMWIVLGKYAYNNGLGIRIEEVAAGTLNQNEGIGEQNALNENGDASTVESNNLATTTTADGIDKTTTQTLRTTTTIQPTTTLETSTEKVLKLTVNGRYSDVADFVFEVENDKSLRFKLDNITMKYSSDNKITATFDVYGLTIRK